MNTRKGVWDNGVECGIMGGTLDWNLNILPMNVDDYFWGPMRLRECMLVFQSWTVFNLSKYQNIECKVKELSFICRGISDGMFLSS